MGDPSVRDRRETRFGTEDQGVRFDVEQDEAERDEQVSRRSNDGLGVGERRETLRFGTELARDGRVDTETVEDAGAELKDLRSDQVSRRFKDFIEQDPSVRDR